MCVRAEKADVCLFQGVTVLSPGQSMVQYVEGELCYTVQCLTHRDPDTGFYAMDVSTSNCSDKCEPVSPTHIIYSIIFWSTSSAIVIGIRHYIILQFGCFNRFLAYGQIKKHLFLFKMYLLSHNSSLS